MKKSVRYSFLDFSTLEKRRYFLQEELRLNRRLAPSVYIDVLPIAFDDLGWRLGGRAAPAEYTLVMRRLPDKRMLPFLLDSGQVTAAMMRELAALLARFHTDAERVTDIDPDQYPALVQAQWNDNLADLARDIKPSHRSGEFNAIEKFGAEFFLRHCETLKRRAANGWLRDVHGDLHANMFVSLRKGSRSSIASSSSQNFANAISHLKSHFYSWTWKCAAAGSLVAPFLQRYRESINDTEANDLLPFWQCYRALVRAKVYALRGESEFDSARRYARYAARIAWQSLQPFIVIVSGLTGSGKSTLARELSERIGVPAINSDIVRKKLAGKQGRQAAPYNQGIYSAAMTEKTYARMSREAERVDSQRARGHSRWDFRQPFSAAKDSRSGAQISVSIAGGSLRGLRRYYQGTIGSPGKRGDGRVGWPLGNL